MKAACCHPSLVPALRRADAGGDLICRAAADAIEDAQQEIERLRAEVGRLMDIQGKWDSAVLTDKDIMSAVITCVMNDKQFVRNEACLKLQRHINAVEEERDALEAECERRANEQVTISST
jgi:hypothetical protein